MAGRLRLKAECQKSRGTTSWSVGETIAVRLWEVFWFLFLRWTPKWMNRFRLLSLRLFGAKIHGRPFVFSSAKIYAPFNLELCDHSCIGPKVEVYNLGKTILNENSIVSQEAFLCGGSHDLSSSRLPLLVGDIEIGRDAFIGVRAIILPGLRVADGSVVGAGAIVSHDVEEWTMVAGNPAVEIGKRLMKND